jgi:plastocyanin
MKTRIAALASTSALAVLALLTVTSSAQTGAAAPAGSVTGQIKFNGTPPRPQRIRMTADPLCMPGEKGDTFETLLVSPTGGIQNVFVYVKDGLGSKTFPPPQTPAHLDQKGCRYVPHVLGVQVGQPILISNSDPAVHNVDAAAKTNKEFNLIQPKGSKPSTKTFDKPEVMVPIRCDVHSWMTAWVGVVPHPFFTVSAADGTFTIKGLPPGTYTIEAWHETLGTQTAKVIVPANKGATTTFTFSKK